LTNFSIDTSPNLFIDALIYLSINPSPNLIIDILTILSIDISLFTHWSPSMLWSICAIDTSKNYVHRRFKEREASSVSSYGTR
jgi:hypothetical protein